MAQQPTTRYTPTGNQLSMLGKETFTPPPTLFTGAGFTIAKKWEQPTPAIYEMMNGDNRGGQKRREGRGRENSECIT